MTAVKQSIHCKLFWAPFLQLYIPMHLVWWTWRYCNFLNFDSWVMFTHNFVEVDWINADLYLVAFIVLRLLQWPIVVVRSWSFYLLSFQRSNIFLMALKLVLFRTIVSSTMCPEFFNFKRFARELYTSINEVQKNKYK